MNNTIYYRVENNRIIFFDWATRTYFQIPHAERQEIEKELLALGYNDKPFLIERKIFLSSENAESNYLASPLAAYIEITNSCNMKCKHCFKLHAPYLCGMSIKKLYAIIDDLEKMGVFELRFVGYEPTTSPELHDIVQYAKSKGFYLVLNTNGFYADEKQNELISYGFNEFLISIDGDKKYHDKLRTKGSFERASSFIEKLGSHKIRTKINMTVNNENIKHITYLAYHASSLNVNFNVIPMRMVGNGERELGKSFALSPPIMLEIAQIVEQLRKDITNIVIYLTYHDYLYDENAIQYHKSAYSDPCPAANNINIMYNGQVYPCDLMASIGDEFCLGNLNETTIFDIWRENERMAYYRSLTKDQKCINCVKYMKRCSGGCFIERYLYNGRKFQDPLCYVHLLEKKQESETQFDRGSFYDETYYMNGIEANKSLYTNYRYMPERSKNDAKTIMQIAEIEAGNTIIDFGSGMGFLMQAFLDKKINSYGVEISQYAYDKSYQQQLVFHNLHDLPQVKYDLLIALSVFEHLTVNELYGVIEFAIKRKIPVLFTVPISIYEGGNYINPIFEKDRSHILRRPTQWWQQFFERAGFNIKVIIDESNELFHNKRGMALFFCN